MPTHRALVLPLHEAGFLKNGSPFKNPFLGCPTSPERRVESEQVLRQDFQRGRIYAERTRAFYVPTVFAQAVDLHGGEMKIGIPVSDPTTSSGASQTWLFQRFRRPGRPNPEATLEIRGTRPRLFVQRRADDPHIPVPGPHSPTIVDEHACAGNLGPCDLDLPVVNRLQDIGRFCNHKHFKWDEAAEALLDRLPVTSIDTDPPEWAAIAGHHVLTRMSGIVLEAKHAVGDLPLTHEFSFDCPKNLAFQIGKWAKNGEPPFCPSDWDVYVAPLRGYRGVLGIGVGSNPEYHEKGVIEYERGHARAFTAFGGDPHVGDLVFAAGRWIVDCGHAYKTEIHPPSVLAYMRESEHNGRPATLAYVWVNGFYPGDPLEVVIRPPPRPSPDAHSLGR